ncbi:NADP-dependent oxidoreductase domain-containing protein [Tricladium varicosporioides]|nr:NADP-dependent oxidoreductase domain-containing protein [Hymenoscyphus varicosporioides]
MPARKTPVPLILGAGNFNRENQERIKRQREILQVARRHGINILDTSRHYEHGESESFLGDEDLASEFDIVTKASMHLGDGSSKEGILHGWEETATALKSDKVSMYLLHVPDDSRPIAETMEGIQALYLAGKFKQFGLSNFSPAQVEECHDYAKSKGYVLPTVYQSIYGPAARINEKELFPVLRKLDISIQGYSALASGFLSKTPDEIKAGMGHFNPNTILGKILHEKYGKPPFLEFLKKYANLVEELGDGGRAGLAYRWICWHSELDGEKGDGIVIGVSSAVQLEQTVEEVEKGPLPEWVVERLESMWKEVEGLASGDNFSTYKKLKDAGLLGV